MTNKEKFYSIFKNYPEINEIDWEDQFHPKGLKNYECIYTYWGDDEMELWRGYPKFVELTEQFVIKAGSMQEARKKAIEKLGSKYRRYYPSNRPMYPLKISLLE